MLRSACLRRRVPCRRGCESLNQGPFSSPNGFSFCVSSPPDWLGAGAGSGLPEPVSVFAPPAASRVHWRRASPVLDPARGADARCGGIALARLAPLVEVEPPPADRPRAKVNRRREGAVRHQGLDRRAAQPGGLHHRGQAREHVRRVGADAQGVSPFARRMRWTLHVRSVDREQRISDNDFRPRVIGPARLDCSRTGRAPACWIRAEILRRYAAGHRRIEEGA
jgi:hypothetical protein